MVDFCFCILAQRKDWLALVAVHSDAWLMAVAFYYGAKFDASKRCVWESWTGASAGAGCPVWTRTARARATLNAFCVRLYVREMRMKREIIYD